MAVAADMATPERPPGVHAAAVYDHDGGRWIDGAYWFDEKAADRVVDFFANKLKLTTGRWAGKPFILEPWQANDIIRPMYGWKREDGTRRYRRVFVWVPRKNGKTELAAGVALVALLGDGEIGGQVYSIASNKDQAELVFNQATMMIAHSPELQDALEPYKASIYCPELLASFKPLSGKASGKHGFNMSGLIGDEIHEWKDGELYLFVHDSADARDQPIEFLISTAGKRGTYGQEVFDECEAIAKGEIEDPETLVVIYAAEPEDDWQAEETWRKANPNLGVSKKLEAMRANAKRAARLPRLENHFKNYHLNLWTDQAVLWLPIDSVDDAGNRYGWDHCKGPIDWRAIEAGLVGKTCYGGLDISSTADLSALIWWFPKQEMLETPVMIARFWKPELLVEEHTKRDRIDYAGHVENGALLTTPGNVIDYAFLRRQVIEDATKFKVAHTNNLNRKPHEGGLAIDRWNATETAVKLQQEGIPVAFYGQGYASMSAPAKELERLVMSNGFHHGGQPLLREHAKAVAIEQDAAENIKPSKDKSTKRIDGIAAACGAIGISARIETVTTSPWNDEDFRIAV
ncbi:terminase large subunit [Hyphococcus flavus]|uniref:Terminase large subunit n=1 Tax=Hyphococcus flavus TaxID=1866326 RepID=A0AAF0CH81_9PROT|nr:terminase TerL endonuclease subunit [Hyphococcus flavus]WDI31602.1 terminase large subunit [Hyphococcus flavus]